MVSMLAIGSKVRGFKPGRDYGILRAIKTRSTSSFGGEAKPARTVRFHCMLQNSTQYERDISQTKSIISYPVS
jgi:hypothetical protein